MYEFHRTHRHGRYSEFKFTIEGGVTTFGIYETLYKNGRTNIRISWSAHNRLRNNLCVHDENSSDVLTLDTAYLKKLAALLQTLAEVYEHNESINNIL